MDHLNSTQPPTKHSDLGSSFTEHVLPPLYFIIFIVGLLLNGLAAFIFIRVPTDSGLVVYLKNMLVADLLMLFTFPIKMAVKLELGGWRLHVVTCRYTSVLFYSSMYAGILFMGFISLERYVKIVRHSSSSSTLVCRGRFGGVSLPHLLQSVGFARVLALLTWSLLLLSVLPNVLLTSMPANEKNARKCMELKTELGRKWHSVSVIFSNSLFWLTLLVLSFCYTSIGCRVYQSHRRVRCNNSNANSKVCHKLNRSILSLLVVFFVCFVPYHVCRIPYLLNQVTESGFSLRSRFLLFQLKEGMLFLSALNVCLDPVIYVLMCQTFRESLLRKLSRRERRRSLTTGQSLSRVYLGEDTRSGDVEGRPDGEEAAEDKIPSKTST